VTRLLVTIALLSGTVGVAQEPPPIQDNSFLLEEAYNQEEGVVQHISAFQRMRGGEWIATFTQEWPAPGQTHQLSYTIPYQRTDATSGRQSGVGDIALNYRYQLAGSGDTRFACTPRVSLLFPTGDEQEALGSGGIGVQINVAASSVLSDRLVAHTNLGGTYTRSTKNERDEEAATSSINAGQSFIWTATPTLNVLVEGIWTRLESVVGPGRTDREDLFIVSPGIRWAHNFASGLQIVPGIAFPLGVGSNRHGQSILLYLSLEHPMWTPRPK
jgi:hypothetical protein